MSRTYSTRVKEAIVVYDICRVQTVQAERKLLLDTWHAIRRVFPCHPPAALFVGGIVFLFLLFVCSRESCFVCPALFPDPPSTRNAPSGITAVVSVFWDKHIEL